MVAEAGLVMFEQAVAMDVLFAAHDAKFLGLFGIIFLQAGGEIFINARILLLERDGQREDFLFGKTVEGFHKSGLGWFGRDAPPGRPRTARRAVPTFCCDVDFHKNGENNRAAASRNFAGTNDFQETLFVFGKVRSRHDRMVKMIHKSAAIDEFTLTSGVVKPAAAIGIRAQAAAHVNFIRSNLLQ